jgi:hypothetical protein
MEELGNMRFKKLKVSAGARIAIVSEADVWQGWLTESGNSLFAFINICLYLF